MNEVPGSFYIEHRLSWNRYNVELMDYSKELLKHCISAGQTILLLVQFSFSISSTHNPRLHAAKGKSLCLPAHSALIISDMNT